MTTAFADPFAPEALRPDISGATLALDLGTNCGWAISQSGVITSGVQSFRPGRYDGGGMRYLRFRRWLDEMRGGSTLYQVVYEEVRRHMGVDAAHCYGGLMATLTAWCEQHSIPYEGIPVGTIKRSACGRGNADKKAMVNAVRAWGFPVTDDNEADAIALVRYVESRKR